MVDRFNCGECNAWDPERELGSRGCPARLAVPAGSWAVQCRVLVPTSLASATVRPPCAASLLAPLVPGRLLCGDVISLTI